MNQEGCIPIHLSFYAYLELPAEKVQGIGRCAHMPGSSSIYSCGGDAVQFRGFSSLCGLLVSC